MYSIYVSAIDKKWAYDFHSEYETVEEAEANLQYLEIKFNFAEIR